MRGTEEPKKSLGTWIQRTETMRDSLIECEETRSEIRTVQHDLRKCKALAYICVRW